MAPVCLRSTLPVSKPDEAPSTPDARSKQGRRIVLEDAESTTSGDSASTREPGLSGRGEDSPPSSLSLASSLTAAWDADQETRVAAAAEARRVSKEPEADSFGVHAVQTLTDELIQLSSLSGWLDAPAAHSPPEALIVWDWDDTLCPTTWLCQEGLTLRGTAPTAEQAAALAALDELVCATLELSQARGTNVIITNAEKGWVELSARTWLPRVAELGANGFYVVSARSMYETAQMTHPIAWKQNAFADVTRVHLAQHGRAVRTLLSFGDSAAERQAALQVWPPLVAGCEEPVQIKTVKLPERPSVERLRTAHTMLAPMLPTLLGHAGHLDLALNVPDENQPFPVSVGTPVVEV